jgi:hypothetical protein
MKAETYNLQYSPRLAMPSYVLLLIGFAAILGITIAAENWLLLLAIAVLPFVLLWRWGKALQPRL